MKEHYTVSVNEPGDLHVEKKNVRREILSFLLKKREILVIVSIHRLRIRKLRNLLLFYLMSDLRVGISDSVEQ